MRLPVVRRRTIPSAVGAAEDAGGPGAPEGAGTDRPPVPFSRSAARRVPVVAALPTPLRLLIATQLAFNVGFYLVVPFLAAHLTHSLHLTGWVVGAVLGLRTFSQQGMFVVGGALADRFGIRSTIIVGCAIRIAGFVALGLAEEVLGVLLGVVLVGFAAALFSPATESAIVAWGRDVEDAGGPSLREIVAVEQMASKLGSILGPVLGAVLLVVPFRTTALVAAAIFGLILLAHVALLPRGARAGERTDVYASMRLVLSHRRFLAFAAIHCTYLFAYNQLYLAAPVEIDRVGAPEATITWLFALAAVVVIGAQMPVTRAAIRWGRRAALRRGYVLIGTGFLVVALASVSPPLPGRFALAPLVVMVVLLHLGQILVLPTARDVVAELAGGRSLGTYLGLLSSAGGLAVLLGSTVAGALLDDSRTSGPGAAVAWLFMAVPPLASAAAVGPFLDALAHRTATEARA